MDADRHSKSPVLEAALSKLLGEFTYFWLPGRQAKRKGEGTSGEDALVMEMFVLLVISHIHTIYTILQTIINKT